MANDMTGINDIYNNGMNDVYGEMPSGDSQNVLPKTGQTVSFISGDDGDLEAGESNVGRFEEQTLDGDDVVIDTLTGLMWPKNWVNLSINTMPKLWEAFFPFIDALSFAGFDDWRMPNVQEFGSIVDHSTNGQLAPNYGLFSNFTIIGGYMCTSTTTMRVTSGALYYSRVDNTFIYKAKTTVCFSGICRDI